MKGVAQNNLRFGFFEVARGHGLHGAVGPDRHKDGRFHATVGQIKPAESRQASRITLD